MKKMGVLVSILFLAGCDYVPHVVHKIKTEEGKIIKLSCPEIDRGRSELTYVYEKQCVIVTN